MHPMQRIAASPLLGPLASVQPPTRNYAISFLMKTRRHGGDDVQLFHFEIPASTEEMAGAALPVLADAVRRAADGRFRLDLSDPQIRESMSVREMIGPGEALSRVRTVIGRSDIPLIYDEDGDGHTTAEMIDYFLRARSISWTSGQTHLAVVAANGRMKTFKMTPEKIAVPPGGKLTLVQLPQETAEAIREGLRAMPAVK
jgi:hypothetical protein